LALRYFLMWMAKATMWHTPCSSFHYVQIFLALIFGIFLAMSILAPILEYVGYQVYCGSNFGIFWPCWFWLQFWNMLAIKSIVAPILEHFGYIYSCQPMGGRHLAINLWVTLGNLAVVHFRIPFFIPSIGLMFGTK